MVKFVGAALDFGGVAANGLSLPIGSLTLPTTAVLGQTYVDANGVEWIATAVGPPPTWQCVAGQPPGVVPPTRIVAFGHSWLAFGGVSSYDMGLGGMIAGAVGGNVENFSVSGALLSHDDVGGAVQYALNGVQPWGNIPLFRVTGGTGNNNGCFGWARILQEQSVAPTRLAAPRVPNGRVGLLLYGVNDISYHHADSGNNPRNAWKSALRTSISRLSASQVFEDTDASVAYGGSGGTWQTAVSITTTNSGSGFRPFPGNGATFTITIPADFEGGTIAVGFVAFPNSDAVITWTGTASFVTGTTTLVAQALNPGAATGLTRNSNVGVVQRWTGLASDAGKTIIGTIGSMTTTAVATAPTPGAITHGGTAGSTTYTYEWVAGNQNGDGLPSTTTSTATGNATLTAANTNIIPAPTFPGNATYMRLVRTVGGASQGVIATITTSVAVTDTGLAAYPYTARTANPLLTGGAFDYWQIEATNPTSTVLVCDIARPLPGTLPKAGTNQDGGYGQGGYTSSGAQSLGTAAITAGGTVGATTVTFSTSGATAAQQASLVAGGIIALTGGTQEGFYISSVTGVGTASTVVTLTNSNASSYAQAGFVRNASHTSVTYGWPSDADVVNYNNDIQSVVNEFPSTVVYVGIDAVINLNLSHYYADGLHLNDRGSAITSGVVATKIGQVAAPMQPFQVAAQSRQRRKPENLFVKKYFFSRGYLDVKPATLGTWTALADSGGTAMRLVVAAKPGDELEIALSGLWGNDSAGQAYIEIATLAQNGTSQVNYISAEYNLPTGIPQWSALIASQYAPISGSIFYTVQAADITTALAFGLVTLQLYYLVTTAARTLYMGTFPFQMSVKNLGTPGYTFGQ